jgi:hypothetical protein
MRAFNRHCAKRERARKARILRVHYTTFKPKKPWKDYPRLIMLEPSWWVREFMTRPARIRSNMMCHFVEMGRDPDSMLWPDSRKPHLYYW